ncbi:MAG TPA: ABC transporter substrate-binding protein [Ilumatobacter sp.]|nr:ABC transporter substrate-binding protein [Ilumatobacter sp.]
MIAACGGDASSDSSESTPESTSGVEVETLKLIIQPLVDYTPLYIGVEQGFFEEEGIDLQMDLSQGGAAAIPAVMSGEAHIGGSNVVSLMTARSKGLEIVAFAPGVKADKEYSAVIVSADSPIQSPADLAGKTLAVNTLRNIGEVTIRAALEGQVDVDDIQFTELGFGQMLPALEQGQIDAAWVVQPFVTQAFEAGARVISYNFEETAPELQVGLMFTSESFANDHPELLERFQRAYARSVTYATGNEAEVRQVLPSFAGIEDSVAEAMSLPIWPDEIDRESVASTGALMVKYGVIPELIDLDAFFGD